MPGKPKSFECKEIVAMALAGGESVAEAAAGANITPRTVFRWLAEDTEFNQVLNRIHGEMMEQSMSLLIEATKRATRRLMRLVGDRNKRIALGACKQVLARYDALMERVEKRRQELFQIACEEARDEAKSKEAEKPAPVAPNGRLSEADVHMFESLGYHWTGKGWQVNGKK